MYRPAFAFLLLATMDGDSKDDFHNKNGEPEEQDSEDDELDRRLFDAM